LAMKRQVAILLGTGVGLVLLAPLVAIWQAARTDPFGFLGGERPLLTGVNGFGDLFEYRVYSWHEDARSVRSKAEAELPKLGFRLAAVYSDSVVWKSPRDAEVLIELGPSQSKKDVWGGKRIKNPSWVTVIVAHPAPENWVTHLRYGLEPSLH